MSLDLDAIKARADAATPGRWYGPHEYHDGRDLGCVVIGDYGWVCAGERNPEYDVDSEQGKADAEFIAHARTDVEVLLDEVERLRAIEARVRKLATDLRDDVRWCSSGDVFDTLTGGAR